MSLLIDRREAVVVISINDAPYNRMSLQFMDDLEVFAEEISGDDSVRAVVITGEGDQNFSVGMNLKELPKGIEEKGSPQAVFDQRLRVLAAIENMKKPWIRIFVENIAPNAALQNLMNFLIVYPV